MLTAPPSCQLRSLLCQRRGPLSAGTFARRIPSSSRALPGWARDRGTFFFSQPTKTTSCRGPKENQPTGKMRTAPVLLWILGSVWLWDSAQGATIGGLEDEIVTPGTDNGMVTPGLEDKIATTGATEEPSVSTSKAEPALTSTESRTKSAIEDLPTPGGSDHGHEENKGTTTVRMVTSDSVDKKTSRPSRDNTAGETETTDKKGGLAVVTLVGIIVGVLLAIGFIGGIIIVIMRKISGRFSP